MFGSGFPGCPRTPDSPDCLPTPGSPVHPRIAPGHPRTQPSLAKANHAKQSPPPHFCWISFDFLQLFLLTFAFFFGFVSVKVFRRGPRQVMADHNSILRIGFEHYKSHQMPPPTSVDIQVHRLGVFRQLHRDGVVVQVHRDWLYLGEGRCPPPGRGGRPNSPRWSVSW